MTQAPSFGVCLAGVPVLLPAGTPLEFIARATVYPLPLAPTRVAGLMQLRGQPLLVLDASGQASTQQASTQQASTQQASMQPGAQRGTATHDVLVIGTIPQAAALLVDGPPQRVDDAAGGDGAEREAMPEAPRGALADCPFVEALTAHRVDRSGEHAGWYEVDPARLFDALMRS